MRKTSLLFVLWLAAWALLPAGAQTPQDTAKTISVSDAHVLLSPYNWYVRGSAYAQSPNPGAYLKLGFTGSSIAVNFDVSPETGASLAAAQYPVIRYSIDNGPPSTVQLTPTTASLHCASGLSGVNHTLFMQTIAGYVFEDFWTPINVVRITGFDVDPGAVLVAPSGAIAAKARNALFFGDSITNGDDDVATFAAGITNAVGTQDASQGYPALLAASVGAEYGIVAFGGASWDNTAADGHTPGLMTFYKMLDSLHSRLVSGKLSPVPTDIFINMGENSGPAASDVPTLLAALRAESSTETNIWVIVPFSGRQRDALTSGVTAYRLVNKSDRRVGLLDIGTQAMLPDTGPTSLSVDGQHPLVQLHALLGAQLAAARQAALLRRHP